LRKIIIILFVFFCALGAIYLFGLDLKISSLMYNSSANFNWIYSDGLVWKFMYRYGNILPNICGIGSAVILLLCITTKIKTDFSLRSKEAKRKQLFMILLFLIAPGLIVQTLKVTWGRPRPVEVKQFGGPYNFISPSEPNFALAGSKNSGNSFPSGHAANAFYMIFPYYVVKRRSRALILGSFGLAYGILMAMTRIVQGAHFLSDVVTSAFIVYITAEVLKVLLLDKPIKE